MFNVEVIVIISNMFIYSKDSRETFSIGGKCFQSERYKLIDAVFEKLMNILHEEFQRNLKGIVIHNSNTDIGSNSNLMIFMVRVID